MRKGQIPPTFPRQIWRTVSPVRVPFGNQSLFSDRHSCTPKISRSFRGLRAASPPQAKQESTKRALWTRLSRDFLRRPASCFGSPHARKRPMTQAGATEFSKKTAKQSRLGRHYQAPAPLCLFSVKTGWSSDDCYGRLRATTVQAHQKCFLVLSLPDERSPVVAIRETQHRVERCGQGRVVQQDVEKISPATATAFPRCAELRYGAVAVLNDAVTRVSFLMSREWSACGDWSTSCPASQSTSRRRRRWPIAGLTGSLAPAFTYFGFCP